MSTFLLPFPGFLIVSTAPLTQNSFLFLSTYLNLTHLAGLGTRVLTPEQFLEDVMAPWLMAMAWQ